MGTSAPQEQSGPRVLTLGRWQPHGCGAQEVAICPRCFHLSILNCRANGLGLWHRPFGFCTTAGPARCVCGARRVCGVRVARPFGCCTAAKAMVWVCCVGPWVLHDCGAKGVALLHQPFGFCTAAKPLERVCCALRVCRALVGQPFAFHTIAKPTERVCCIGFWVVGHCRANGTSLLQPARL